MHVPAGDGWARACVPGRATRRSAPAACSTRSSTGPASAASRQPAGRRCRGRARRGHEAVSELRLAAAGDGRRGAAQVHPRRARSRSYDVVGDPGETRRPRGRSRDRRRCVPAALRDYPVPSPSAAPAPDALDPEARRSLASLGYVSAGAAPVVRKDAPRPADMVRLFAPLEQASALFVGRSSTRRPSRSSSGFSRPIPTTSTRCSGLRRRIRRSGTTGRPRRCSRRRRGWRRSRPT